MSINNYSVLKGTASEFALDNDNSPHFEIRIEASNESYRVAVNVRSSIHPHDLLYLKIDNFNHPMLNNLEILTNGLHSINNNGLELDYIQGGFLKKEDMFVAPYQLAGAKNDLREYVEPIIKENLNKQDVSFYAFGEPWGPDSGNDRYFDFSPKRGIHNIHMNQGSQGRFSSSNGAKQDGALFIHLQSENRWIAFFFAFQSQLWGEKTIVDRPPLISKPSIKIIAALVNPANPEAGKENITLINRSDANVDLNGWHLVDKNNRKFALSGVAHAGRVFEVTIGISQQIMLSNKGGRIELHDKDGVIADSVTYSKQDVQQEGWTTLF